jgi:NAD(P)-dependent dehydrogenase (short-subunit alcohol dehydrogenase family)
MARLPMIFIAAWMYEMSAELAGKVAIVTGGASGIGQGIVERFVEAGAHVVVADVDLERGQAVADSLSQKARFRRADVSSAMEVEKLVAFAVSEFGGLHVMVNNAGISGAAHSRFLDDDLSDFDRVIGVNLRGVMLGTRYAGLHMRCHGGGSIINTSSIAAKFAGYGILTYRASKAGVLQFSRSVAIDLAVYNIRVNCISPGHIATEMGAFSGGSNISIETLERLRIEMNLAQSANQPLKRKGRPSDVAEAALYLAGDSSAYVTGIDIAVDGGTSLGDPVNQLERMLAVKREIVGG